MKKRFAGPFIFFSILFVIFSYFCNSQFNFKAVHSSADKIETATILKQQKRQTVFDDSFEYSIRDSSGSFYLRIYPE